MDTAVNRNPRESRHVHRPETPQLPPTFNRLAWSNLAAQSAEQIALAAAPIVAVLLLGVGEGQTGILQTALTLPFILFAIPAGLLADRIARRWLMAGSEALRAVGAARHPDPDPVLNGLSLPLLALFGFVAVCGTVVYSVAAPALVPSLVAPRAVTFRQCADRTGAHGCFCQRTGARRRAGGMGRRCARVRVCRRALVIAVVLLSGIYEPARQPAPRRHPLQEIKEGAHSCCTIRCCGRYSSRSSSSTRPPSWCSRCSCPMRCAVSALSATGVGTTLAMYGVGMVVGALLATRVMRRLPFGIVIGLGAGDRICRRDRDGVDHAIVPSPEFAGP